MIVRRRPPNLRPWFWELVGRSWLLLARIKFRVRVRWHGQPELGASVIICAKHASAFDIALLGVLSKGRTKRRPYFQMGSFIGYRVFGRIRPFMRALGGFEVMRPKEARTLTRMPGWDRRAALEHMRDVNAGAEEIRRELLMSERVLAFFPEGTRDDAQILPLVSKLELNSALAAAATGARVIAWPVTVAMGEKRLRRRMDVDFGVPFDLDPSAPAQDILDRVGQAWDETWRPPPEVDASV